MWPSEERPGFEGIGAIGHSGAAQKADMRLTVELRDITSDGADHQTRYDEGLVCFELEHEGFWLVSSGDAHAP